MKQIKSKLIRFFGLKGSWAWAKRQMMAGKIVRCRHWSGSMKLKIDSPENGLLIASWQAQYPLRFETSNHHLRYEDFTDYEVWGGDEVEVQKTIHQGPKHYFDYLAVLVFLILASCTPEQIQPLQRTYGTIWMVPNPYADPEYQLEFVSPGYREVAGQDTAYYRTTATKTNTETKTNVDTEKGAPAPAPVKVPDQKPSNPDHNGG